MEGSRAEDKATTERLLIDINCLERECLRLNEEIHRLRALTGPLTKINLSTKEIEELQTDWHDMLKKWPLPLVRDASDPLRPVWGYTVGMTAPSLNLAAPPPPPESVASSSSSSSLGIVPPVTIRARPPPPPPEIPPAKGAVTVIPPIRHTQHENKFIPPRLMRLPLPVLESLASSSSPFESLGSQLGRDAPSPPLAPTLPTTARGILTNTIQPGAQPPASDPAPVGASTFDLHQSEALGGTSLVMPAQTLHVINSVGYHYPGHGTWPASPPTAAPPPHRPWWLLARP